MLPMARGRPLGIYTAKPSRDDDRVFRLHGLLYRWPRSRRRYVSLQIVVLLPDVPDGLGGPGIIAAAGPEFTLCSWRSIASLICRARPLELLRKNHKACVAAGKQEQAAPGAGDKDIHGRGDRFVERTAAVIAAGVDEVGQNVVGVGCADECCRPAGPCTWQSSLPEYRRSCPSGRQNQLCRQPGSDRP